METDQKYIYGERAVAFLDVLGFQNKLVEFENEAIHYKDSFVNGEAIDENGEPISASMFYSAKANDFIDTFNSAISKLNKDNFSFYLFSDNICITASKVNTNSERSLMDLLLVISELYYEFAKRGYFLRGGIDYGLFIDKSSIALGVPLAKAYKIESEKAVFPRIVLSKDFVKQFEVYSSENQVYFTDNFTSSLIKKSCEIDYLNVFLHIFQIDDKEDFFNQYNKSINDNIAATKHAEHVNLKFQWLASEFNAFIDDYTESLAYFDEDFEATNEFIDKVKNLRI